MLTAKNSPLVAGAAAPASSRALAWLRVLRPFLYGGQVIDRGVVRQFDSVFAAELVTGGKAERVAAPAAPADPPTPAPAKGKKEPHAQL